MAGKRAVQILIVLLLILSLLVGTLGRYHASQAHVPHFRKVAVLVLENHGYSQIIGSPQAPYLNDLAAARRAGHRLLRHRAPVAAELPRTHDGLHAGRYERLQLLREHGALAARPAGGGAHLLEGVLPEHPGAGLRRRRRGRLQQALQPVRVLGAGRRGGDRPDAPCRLPFAAARPEPALAAPLLLDHAQPPERRAQRVHPIERPLRRAAGAAHSAGARAGRGPVRDLGRGAGGHRPRRRPRRPDRDRARRPASRSHRRPRRPLLAARHARGRPRPARLGHAATASVSPLVSLLERH